MTKYLIIIISGLFLLACGTQKSTKNMDQITKENLTQLMYADMPYQHIKINGKVKVDMPGKSLPAVKLTIYNVKGKEIWMNGQVAIINAGRALATPEKFQAYEKLTKTYIDESYAYINEMLGVNFIDYSSLEKLLLGKVFVPLNLNDCNVSISDSLIQIQSQKPMTVTMDGKEYNYFIDLTFDGNLNLSKVHVVDKENQKDLNIDYLERENFDNMNLPKLVNIVLQDTKPKEITLNYSNFENTEMQTNFEIPSGYTKREIK